MQILNRNGADGLNKCSLNCGAYLADGIFDGLLSKTLVLKRGTVMMKPL